MTEESRMYDLVIRGGTVVTPETVLTTDIGIFGEKDRRPRRRT